MDDIVLKYFSDDPLASDDVEEDEAEEGEVNWQHERHSNYPNCSCGRCPVEKMISKCCQEDVKAKGLCEGRRI